MSSRALVRLAAAALVGSFLTSAAPSRAQEPKAPGAKLTQPPKLLHFEAAPHPVGEGEAPRAATVVLRLTIGLGGAVEEVAVVESAGAAFDEAASKAARQFLFSPAEVDGKPSRVRILYRYEFVVRVEAKTTGSLHGVVRRRDGKGPVAGATVEIAGKKVTTDEEGRFSLGDLPVGEHAVTLEGDGLTGLRLTESIEAGVRRDVVYELEPRVEETKTVGDDIEIVVRAPAIRREVVSTQIDAEEARRVPGTQGDVLKVVESMPGVGRAAAGSSALVVWGAAPGDTRVYVDGVRIPMLYHLGGFRSVVHTDLVRSVDLVPGGYGSAYGRGLGGLITVGLAPLDESRIRGSVTVDALDAAARVSTPLGDRVRLSVSARRSHLDTIVDGVTTRDVGVLVPIPTYRDAQILADVTLTPSSMVRAGFLWSDDSVTRSVAAVDPADRKTESNNVGFYRAFVRWQADTGDGSTASVVASFGHDRNQTSSLAGVVPASLTSNSDVYGLRASWRGRVEDFLTVSTGIDVEAVRTDLTREGSPTTPPREGDIRAFGQAPAGTLSSDAWSTTIGSVAPYAEADFSLLGEALHLVPGIRFEPYVTAGSRKTPQEGDTPPIGYQREDTAVEPRFAARARLGESVMVKAAYGLYHQSPQPEDLSAVFGNPDLAPAMARHALASVHVDLARSLDAEVTAFDSLSTGLAVRSQLSSPLLAQALVPQGRGHAHGLQGLIRQKLAAGFFGWLSYSLVRSERADSPSGAYRLFDYDQTHVLTALASYDLGLGFELGVRLRYATGLPRTPVLGVYYDARLDAYQPLFGAHNSIRIPAFFQADVRGSKRFTVGPTQLSIYLDLQNVSNRRNAEEFVYSRDYSQRSTISGLPILPVAGASLSW